MVDFWEGIYRLCWVAGQVKSRWVDLVSNGRVKYDRGE